LLRRGDQHVPLLRRETIGLDGVHHVFRLVVIRIAKLRRPRGILGKVVEHGGELGKTFNGRVPIHRVRRGSALLRRQCQVRV
jgi:hypothetical protein